MPVTVALGLHCLCVAIALSSVAYVLWRRELLTLLHSGTWILFACSLFFLLNPVVSLCTGDLALYTEALAYCNEGASRIFWVLVLVLTSILVFFATYVRGRGPMFAMPKSASQPRQIRWTLPTMAVVGVFIAVGALGMLYYSARGQFVDSAVAPAEYDHGRIVAGSTGYTVIAHNFYIYPALLLVFRGPTVARLLGYLLMACYVGVRLFDPWDRASVVSLIAAVAMMLVARRQWSSDLSARLRSLTLFGGFKSLLIFVPVIALTAMLVARGHTPISETTWDEDRSAHASEVLVRNDTAMLPSLYARSNMTENMGFDYGVPLLTAVLFGSLPRQYFPWKDDLTSILLDPVARRTTLSDDRWIYGPKITLVGCFYEHGGLIGVILGMFGLGLVARVHDRLVALGKTDLGRCVGIMWMAHIWIMYGSNDVWILNRVFASGLPFFSLIAVTRLQPRGLLPLRSTGPIAHSVGVSLRV